MRFEDFVFVYQLRDEGRLAWHCRPHSHGEGRYELHYFLSGEGSFRDRRSVYSIGPGRLFVTPPGATHQVLAAGKRRPVSYYALLVDALGDQEALVLLEGLGARTGPYALGS